MPKRITESGVINATPTAGGNMLIQLITPGVGSSGEYSAAVLESAARDRVFSAGTLMFADHPSETEAYDRPERSIRDVAGVLVEDARWDGTGLVAEARTYSPWTQVLAEMADAIGVSIRASAEVGEAKPGQKPVIARLVEAVSVDFVTHAGRGGAIRQVYESARAKADLLVHDATDPTNIPRLAIEYVPTPAAESGPPNVSAPAGQPQSPNPQSEEDNMGTIQVDEAQHALLAEAAGRVPTLETELDAAQKRADAAEQQLRARDNEAAARAVIAREAKGAGVEFTALESRGLLAGLPLSESGTLDEATFVETVKAGAAEKAATTRGATITGFGAPPTTTDWAMEAEKAAAAAFGRQIKEA